MSLEQGSIWKMFAASQEGSQNVMVDFCQNKREQLLLLTNFFGLSIRFQALFASFRVKNPNKQTTKDSRTEFCMDLNTCEELESEATTESKAWTFTQ